MENDANTTANSRHISISEPSRWVRRFAPLIPLGGAVLDLACGNGRHARHFLQLGFEVVAVDRDIEFVADLSGQAEIVQADLEDGGPWPFAGRTFSGIVVVNYLHRPLLPLLGDSIAEKGVLIYETFAIGNERFTRPRNPDHLLKDGELLELVSGSMQVIAYEHGIVEAGPLPGVKQRICAVNDSELHNLSAV